MFFLCVSAAARADFGGSDNFSGATVDNTKWGTDFGSGVGEFTQANGVLEFSTGGTPTSNDQVIQFWTANLGSYTSDWNVQLDVNVPQFPLTSGQELSMGLTVVNNANTDDSISMFFQQDPNGPPQSIFVAGVDAGSNHASPEQRTSSEITSAKVSISFDAATHTLTSSYDAGSGWTALTSQDISSGSFDWGMDGSSSFEVAIVGFAAGDTAVAATDGVYADNFVAVPEPGSCALVGIEVAGIAILALRKRTFIHT